MPTIRHEHIPIYRVARAGWANPLDTGASSAQSNRWNRAGGQHVLYTCCSEVVASAVVHDVFKMANLKVDDLMPDVRPVLIELSWSGEAVDMASAPGILECGFPLSYPENVEHAHTQPFAEAWLALGAEAVLCRSASMWRNGHKGWMGSHEAWSELAIFMDRTQQIPGVVSRREDNEWLG